MILREVTLPIASNKQCGAYYRQRGREQCIISGTLCAGEAGKSLCFGDSGGPAVWIDDENNRVYQIGIVSWGGPVCTKLNAQMVFTRITEYLDWIEGIIREFIIFLNLYPYNLLTRP